MDATEQAAVEARIKALEEGQKADHELIQKIKDDTAELLEVFKAAQVAGKFFIQAAKFGKAITYLAGGFAALVAVWHYIISGGPKL